MKEQVYFKGLHGLRFFAALAVIVTHTELIKGQMNYDYYYESSKLVFELGGLGVIFFFVLSGFLITYLLLVEKKQEGTIRVKDFYMRRILRIWPLYFIIVLAGFFILPFLHFMDVPYFKLFTNQFNITNLLLFLLMLPNLAFILFNPLPHIGHTWSIGVEEQFYLIWPWVVRRSKNILLVLVLIIVGLIGLKISILILFKVFPGSNLIRVVKVFFAMFKIESMAIGGIGAWMVFEHRYLARLLNNYILVGSFVLAGTLIYFSPTSLQDGIFLIYSVLFLLIILNISLNPNSLIRLENKLFRMLGRISYGIYMYHMIAIAMVLGVLRAVRFPVRNAWFSQLVLYTASIGLSVLMAWLSYRYLETGFLKLKSKFTRVKSGDATRNEKEMPGVIHPANNDN